MPEDLPPPKESIQELQRREQQLLQQRSQPLLFDKAENTGQKPD